MITDEGFEFEGGGLQELISNSLSNHRNALVGPRVLRNEREEVLTKPSRCAIYTRKSSEEGLDQSFNSLHAQREACEAYILSQKHEGWHALSAKYDDG
jgi:hypothetical protein